MGHRLVAATPPRDVKRVPRVAKDRKWWKAKEFENGLLYFSIPELKGILDTAGTAHWAGLPYYVEAKHQCPGHGASQGLLVGLYFQVKNLHGKVCITFNVQQLLHVVKSVHH